MEPCFCETHADRDKNGSCMKCLKPKTNPPLFQVEEPNWRIDRDVMVTNGVFSTNTESRLSINSADSIDAPLLLNDHYNEFEVSEEFHCHFNNTTVRNNRALRKLTAASCMCLFFMVTEIVGGFLANSLSVMTDAAHLMSDFIGFLISLFSIWIGQRTRTKRMSFGFYRAEVLGALFSIVVVWMLTAIFMYLAILRLIYGKYDINADTMMVVSAIGVFINVVMGMILHGFCQCTVHSHSGTSSHTHKTRLQNNINVRAAIIHVLGDFIQSVGVLIASIIIKFYPDAKIADPICTFIFSIIVIFTTRNVLRDTLNVLMEGVPLRIKYNDVKSSLATIEGVRHVHNLHIWSLTLDKLALSVHLAVDKFCDKENALAQATRLVKIKYSIVNATIQIETHKEMLISNCAECQLPKD